MVLSATYEARAFGVASAMPMARARRLCPQATVVQPDYARYERISRAVMALFASITPVVEPLSLDEAFLDVAGPRRRLGSPAAIAQRIRDTVADEQGITCSVGVASTKFVAKLASGLAKPDGLLVVPEAEVVGFLHQLPVGALWGVGERTEEALGRLGLRTVADIAHTPVDTLRRALGDNAGAHLHALAWGRDTRAVVPDPARAEHRRRRDLRPRHRRPRRHPPPPAQAQRPHRGAGPGRRDGRAAPSRSRCGSPTSRRSPGPGPCATPPTSAARSTPRPAPCSTTWACSGPGSGWSGCGWRAWSTRRRAPIQGLLDAPEHGWRDADRAVDRASARFGAGAVRPASLVQGGDSAIASPGRDIS